MKEEVDGPNIRSQPQHIADVECFKVLQEVDALFNSCWWVGVIFKVLDDKIYVVYFYETKDEMEFRHCDLRQHQDWILGQWAIASREVCV